eukprot:486156_1
MGNTHSENKKLNHDAFIVQYNKYNKHKLTDPLLLDNRRVVFVSLIGMYNTWHKCPPVVLHSALCVIQLKKNWIYQPSKYMNEIKTKDGVFALFQYIQNKSFLELLKWKDSQGTVFWMEDEINPSDPISVHNKEDIIAKSWHVLSNKLTSLYDPITGSTYNPIIFDKTFWTQKYDKEMNYQSRFGAKMVSVLIELYGLSTKMKYKSVQEIIYQSNPKSLNVVTSYNGSNINKQMPVFTQTEINGQNEWIVSSDYL